MKSVFTNKAKTPSEIALEDALGDTFPYWQKIAELTLKFYPDAVKTWAFSGEKFGWSYRIKDKKRILIYLLPRENFFKVAFVFGQKATDAIMQSTISDNIKVELKAAKVYAEGRGIRIEIKDAMILQDIEKLIEIKISH